MVNRLTNMPFILQARFRTLLNRTEIGHELTTSLSDNHDQQSFCEIHYCLSNGADEGGMVSLFYALPSNTFRRLYAIIALLRR